MYSELSVKVLTEALQGVELSRLVKEVVLVVDYRARVIDGVLEARLRAVGCVVIEGPKAVGKTATAARHSASEVRLDVDVNAREIARADPSLVLEGAAPRLIDEWQIVPDVWNHVRRAVDDIGEPGQFILTGSTAASEDSARHSGAGRMSRLAMRPMSLLEAGRSSGSVSLRALFDGAPSRAQRPGSTIPELVDWLCVGGWPAHAESSVHDAQIAHRAYLAKLARVDMRVVDGVRRDPQRVQRVLRSLARNVATAAEITTIARDTGVAPDGAAVGRLTVDDYLDALARLMITEDLGAWTPSVRSRARLRSRPVRHLADPCLAVAALRASPKTLLADWSYTGLLFESMALRDVRVYLDAIGGTTYHYRDSNGLEVDIIVELDDGRWGAFEVKLGENRIEDGAESLTRFAQTIDLELVGRPAFLAVLTGANVYASRRPDGIDVVPIAALGP
jgi:predicted AAA+ superfamily ATPase